MSAPEITPAAVPVALLDRQLDLLPGATEPQRRLFAALSNRPGEVVLHTELGEAMGSRAKNLPRALSVFLVHIRNLLPAGCEIIAIRGRGYLLMQRQ